MAENKGVTGEKNPCKWSYNLTYNPYNPYKRPCNPINGVIYTVTGRGHVDVGSTEQKPHIETILPPALLSD